MPETIKFLATVHAVRFDKEGEGRITFTVPSSNLPEMMKAVLFLEKIIMVEIAEELPF